MSDIAVGALVELAYVTESSFGETPAGPAMQKVRRVTHRLDQVKDTYRSEETRSDRQTSDLRHGYERVEGDLVGELSGQSWDDLLEALLGGTWTAGASVGPFSSVGVAADRITCSSAGFISSGFRIGDVITITGSDLGSSSGKRYAIASVDASTIVVQGSAIATVVAAAASVAVAVVGHKLLMGNTKRSFTFEESMTDVAWRQVYRGVRVSSGRFELPPTGIARITFGLMGREAAAMGSAAVGSAYAAAPTTTPMAAVNGELYEGDQVMAFITGLELALDNGLSGQPVVGSNKTPDLFWGRRASITGQLTVLFTDPTMFNKFANETESVLDVRIQSSDNDQTADFLRFRLPRIKYTGGQRDMNADTAIPVTMPFEALKPSATDDDASAIVVQRSNS
jgi:hypothetical protein